jgi:hypothetical protein
MRGINMGVNNKKLIKKIIDSEKMWWPIKNEVESKVNLAKGVIVCSIATCLYSNRESVISN